ncbi:MAG: hypothetical protein IJV29_06835 [Butyrivibrio sp.]|nr:hypothetical protein [Butyrivibrio sp.]MCR4834048.1 hypothetical protein [Butyrivibrio sp.]
MSKNLTRTKLSLDELKIAVGGVTRRRARPVVHKNLICNTCFWEPTSSDTTCSSGCKCPKCKEGTIIEAVG